METIKRKKLKAEDIVISYINTEMGEVDYSLREGNSIRVDTKEQKEYRANHKEIKKDNLFIKTFKDTILMLVK